MTECININENTIYFRAVQVVRADFSPQDWSDKHAHYTVLIEAAIDNSIHEGDLELAPWC